MELEKFKEQGFLEEFKVDLGINLKNLQEKIYFFTKDLLVDHNADLPIKQKLNLSFKSIPEDKIWSNFMNEMNNSQELKNIIEDDSTKNSFKKIFKDPVKFDICTFRARFPNQKRVIYNWHQDEGTWFVSKNKNLQNKYSATLWFSVNGADKSDSIKLVKFSHKKKLYDHNYIKGQGYFSANINEKIDEALIYTVNAKESEAVLFHPLTLHRSVAQNTQTINMRPRYSIDIRYFDKNLLLKYDTAILFKIKKFLNNLR